MKKLFSTKRREKDTSIKKALSTGQDFLTQPNLLRKNDLIQVFLSSQSVAIQARNEVKQWQYSPVMPANEQRDLVIVLAKRIQHTHLIIQLFVLITLIHHWAETHLMAAYLPLAVTSQPPKHFSDKRIEAQLNETLICVHNTHTVICNFPALYLQTDDWCQNGSYY